MEGNQMKMREALVEIRDAINKWYGDDYISHGVFSVLWNLCSDALSAPPRQCDVGSASEKTKRFSDFCAAHSHTDLPRCAGCPLENTPSDTGCSFAWEQMPYEADGGNAK